jgi:tRNA-splicing ligase RtcB
MNTKDLIRLGVPVGEPIKLAHEFIQNFIAQGNDDALLEGEIFNVVANPPAFFADELRAALARAIYRAAFTPRAELAPWRQWGEGLEAEAVKQMANACALPVAVAGALMPDAHVGYGLPIGGVLATDNAVIPYAVGVDIACRMKLTVYDRKANTLAGQRHRLANLIESATRFGMGCEFKQRREHDVMEEDSLLDIENHRILQRHDPAFRLEPEGLRQIHLRLCEVPQLAGIRSSHVEMINRRLLEPLAAEQQRVPRIYQTAVPPNGIGRQLGNEPEIKAGRGRRPRP